MLQTLRGSGLKTRLLNPVDTFWELRLGVDTLDWIPEVGRRDDGHWRGAYVPTRYQGIVNALRFVALGPDDSFLDLGCGLGRPVFAAAWLGAQRSVGVEIDERLCQRARANAQRARVKGPVEFVTGSATDYVPHDTTVLFMFNPFGTALMKAVIANFERELNLRPRRLRIVYENPLQGAVLDASPLLRRTAHWAPRQQGNKHPVSFWESV